jgi:hypothetical protein
MTWSVSDVSFEMFEDLTDDPVVTIVISTPIGEVVMIAEVETPSARVLVLRKTHIAGLQANTLGGARIRQIARAALEKGDYDEIVVEGATRTTGANPGHVPPPYRFARRN